MNLRKLSTLQRALAASVAVHALLLTVRFVDPEAFNRVFEDTPLEVVLVNARTNERPVKAQAIAQASLAGGGSADAGRASSPLPPTTSTDDGDALEASNASMVQSMQEQQALLLAQVKSQLAQFAPPDPALKISNAEQIEREEKRKQLARVLAEIENRINLENARPKKRYISPATQEAVYAAYYDSLRLKVEEKGTENFPTAAGRKLYGSLTMVITVNHDGQVLMTDIAQPSGNPLLDRRAEQIARSAAPFGPFSSAMRKHADQILVVSRFTFTREETLQARMSGQP